MGRRRSLARFVVPLLLASLVAGLGTLPGPVAASGVIPPSPTVPALAAPVLGGQLFSTGSRVEVQVLPASAGFTSELWLFEPGPARRLATNRDVGLVVDVGTFPAGVELVFGIKVLNTGHTFLMGPGDRNPDGIPHATVNFLEPGRAQVGFEDLLGGGDRDYNDNMFEFRGGIVEEPPSGPTADAGPDQTVDEGAVVTLDGTASTDPDSQNLTYSWALAGHVGPPITLSSSTSVGPTFQTVDDGSYTFTLTVSDGTTTDTDQVVVTVRNVKPVLSAQADPAYAGGVALVTTSFTDAGILDTHAGTLDWGDGSAAQAFPVSAQGTGWGTLVASHVYRDPGSYSVTVTITDDDGGAASTTVAGLQVIVPVALWGNSNSSDAAMETTSGAVTVIGLTHTNDDLRIRGGAKSFTGPTEYVRTLDVGGAGATFVPPAVRTGIKPFPITFPIADYRPGGRAAVEAGPAYHDMSASCGSNGFWQVTGSTLSSGVYYANCGVKLNGHPLGGTITIAAEGEIHVSGSSAFFDPYIDGLLFVSSSTSTNAIRINASKSTFVGFLFAERGRIVLTGSNDKFYCGILGDRIDVSAQNLRVQASGCARPARTIAPPTLVPTLTVDITVDRADVLPGEQLRHTATVTNSGATLVVPGVIGIENLGTAQATVTGHELGLEYQSATGGAWHPLPGQVTISLRPNAATGVAYPSGAQSVNGTTAQPGALASWGYAAVVDLTAAQIAFILDPAQVSAVRNVSTFTIAPASVPVRRLFRFGDDFIDQLRSLGANATNVAVTIVPPAGDARTFTATTTPGLGVLSPGVSIAVSHDSMVPAPADRADDESDAAYLARLATFDGTLLAGTAFARGSAGIGPVLAPADLVTSTRHLPVVALDKTGPATIEAGTTAQYALGLHNGGSAEARQIVLTDAIAGVGARPVSGSPTTLAPGAGASATASYPVPANVTQALVNTGTVRWSDATGRAYGPLNDALTTTVIAPRKLAVVKSDVTMGSSGGDPAITYEIAVTNLGDQAVSGVIVSDSPDPLTSLVVGSVTTTAGSITSGNAAGDTAVGVSLGTLAGRTTQVISFDVSVGSVPEGVAAVSNQATVTSVELPPILSDDPAQPGATDPTTTPVGPTSGGGGGGGGGEARPLIGAPSPADGSIVTEPVTISAEIAPPEGQSVASWRITATRAGTTGETTLATGGGLGVDEAVTASAEFDPTTLPNGTYLITIRSTASGGGTQVSTTSLIVDGNLKLGRYETTYQDLSVGVAGLPMRVMRTYDSFDKAVGDFGVGWNLELANFRVQVNRPLGYGGWVQETFGCGFIFCQTRYRTTIPHAVTVVWPDGHQEIFDLAPANGSTFFAPLTAAGFTGRPRTTSTLQADGDTSLSYFGDGNLYGGGFGSGGIYDPQRYRLTDRGGTVYLLDRTSGLVSATDRNGNTLTVTPAGVTSSLGPSITFTRDGQGRITKVVGPAAETITYGYDGAGDLTSFTSPTGGTFTYAYDDDHNLEVSRDPANRPFRTVTYDGDGRMDSVTDGVGNTTTLDVSLADRREIVTDPTGELTTIVYHDDSGDVVRTDQIFDGRTITTTATYDDLDRLETETDAEGGTTAYDWNDDGDLIRVEDQAGRGTTMTYDDFGLLTTMQTHDGTVVLRLFYDDAGNLQRQEAADGTATRFTWVGGHLRTVADDFGHTSSFEYTPEGWISKSTTPDGAARTFTYDGSGRTLTVSEPGPAVSRFTYDGAGSVLTATDPLNRVRRYTYDAFDRVVTESDYANRTTTYTYDAAGRLERRTDRNGQVVAYTYDDAGRIETKTLPGGLVTTYDYDPLGRPLDLRGPDGRIEYAYDDASRIVSTRSSGTAASSQPTVALGFGYDAAGVQLFADGPLGRTTYTYDERNRLEGITDPDGGDFGFEYDELDRLTGMTRPNGVTDTLAYEPTGQLESRVSRLGPTILASAQYAYGQGFLRTSQTDLSGPHGFGFDTFGRLTSATHPAGSGLPNQTFSYDASGNRTSWTGSPAPSTTYDAGARLTGDGRNTYLYDLEGNLVRRTERSTGRITTFHWNADHQLVSVDLPNGTTSRYRYDPVGRRVEVNDGGSIRRYAYDGPNVIAEYDASNALVRGYLTTDAAGEVLASREAGAWRYYSVDGLGSVTATTNESGSVERRLTYDTFGTLQGATANETYAFTGHQFDAATGLYHARARYYDPATGRFISEDPIPSLNAYAYAANDPVNLLDTSGAQVIAERGLLERIREGIGRVVLEELGVAICQELVTTCLLGFGGGPNLLGSEGERIIGDALGPGANPQVGLGNRRPDFQLGLDFFESKNTKSLALTRQLRETAQLALDRGGQYFIVTRASTAMDGLSGPLRRFVASTPGVFIIGCLPG